MDGKSEDRSVSGAPPAPRMTTGGASAGSRVGVSAVQAEDASGSPVAAGRHRVGTTFAAFGSESDNVARWPPAEAWFFLRA